MTTSFAELVHSLNARQSGGTWMAKCPAHEDRNPSLAIVEKDGKPLVRCHAGCDQSDVIAALRDLGLWQKPGHQNGKVSPGARPAKTSPRPAGDGRRQLERDGWIVAAEFAYGKNLRKVRFEHRSGVQAGKGRPAKTFRWEHQRGSQWYAGDGGETKLLYVNAAFRERDQIGLAVGVEGEAKADALGDLGYAAFSFRELSEDAAAGLADVDVVLWPDKDEAGFKKALIAAELIGQHARSLRLIAPPADLPTAGDVVDAIAAGWPAPRYSQLIEDARVLKRRSIGSISEIRSIRDYAGQNIDFLVEGLIAAGTVTMISGESGSGKSTLASAIGGAVSIGRPFAGLTTRQRPVLVIDKENPLSVVVERLERLGITDGPEFRIWGGWCEEEPVAPSAAIISQWVDECERKPLILVDSLVAFCSGDENDAGETRKYMNAFRKLADAGATVLLLHHSGKAETAKEYRGSSDIKASLDVGYHLANLGEPNQLSLLRLRAFKARFSVSTEVVLRYHNGRFTTDDRGPAKTNTELLQALMIEHPGVRAADFEGLAVDKGVGRMKAREFIANGIISGAIRVDKGPHNTRFHTWIGGDSDAEN